MSYRVDRCEKCGHFMSPRTLEQNDLLHATLQDIAEQKEWAGMRIDVETWKRLMTAAWERASGRHVRLLPAVDGHGMDVLYQRTSRLNKGEMAELIEYVTAWAIDNGVKLHDPVVA